MQEAIEKDISKLEIEVPAENKSEKIQNKKDDTVSLLFKIKIPFLTINTIKFPHNNLKL